MSCGPLLPGCVRAREGEIPVFFKRFAFVREHRNAGLGNCGGGVVLRRENVAARPAHRRAEFHERLDENRRLDGHVQRAGDAHALERLARAVFFADGHQAGHFVLGNLNGFAAPFGEREVADGEILFGRAVAVGFRQPCGGTEKV